MYHALALLSVACSPTEARARRTAGWLFLAGIVLFSGSLYVLTLGGVRWMGAVTPFGGVAFLLGWLVLAGGASRASG